MSSEQLHPTADPLGLTVGRIVFSPETVCSPAKVYGPLNLTAEKQDKVDHPKHYTSHPSGVECIQITEHHNFCVGNAIKYIWRAGLKDDSAMSTKSKQIEDIRKAIWYLTREVERLEKNNSDSQ